MQQTLGDFIRGRRETIGLNQTELAKLSDVPRETINRIENNKTQLPFADTRRRLAKALGVSHLQLLIAAGEITEDEIGQSGAVGIVDRDADSPMEKLIARIRAVPESYGLDRNIELALRIAEEEMKKQAGK